MVVLRTQVAMQLMNLQNKATHLGKGTFIADMSPTGSVIDLKKNNIDTFELLKYFHD